MAVVAEKGDDSAAVALSAFVKALYETNMCAVVRRVYASNSPIKIGCLIPHIKNDYEVSFFFILFGSLILPWCVTYEICLVMIMQWLSQCYTFVLGFTRRNGEWH